MDRDRQQSPIPLAPDEIREIAPRELILHVIRGVKYAEEFSISVMLDVPQDDPALSLGTGYEFIADPNTFEDVCKFVREHKEKSVSGRCPASDKTHFEKARQRVRANPSYRGEWYRCGSIQLIDFVVPIYEPLSRTFIGVVFGCQRRPVEDEQQVEARLSKYVAQSCPHLSEDIEELCSLYQHVPQATKSDIDEMMEVCRGIAESLQQRFRFYVETRHREAQRLEEERAVAEINRALVEAQDLRQFWLAMPQILDRMAEWVPFDWAFVLRWHGGGASPRFRVCVSVGRGLPSADRINEVFRDVLLPPLEEHDCGEYIPRLFHEEIAAWSLPADPTQLDITPVTTTQTETAMVSAKTTAVSAVNGIVETVKAIRGGLQDTATVYGPYVDLVVNETAEGDEQTPGVWLSVGQTVTVEMSIKPTDLPDGDVILSVLGSAQVAWAESDEPFTGPAVWRLSEITWPASFDLTALSAGFADLRLDYVPSSGTTFHDAVNIEVVNVQLTGREPVYNDADEIIGYEEIAEHVEEESGVLLVDGETRLILEDPGVATGSIVLAYNPAAVEVVHPAGEFVAALPVDGVCTITIPCCDILGERTEFVLGEPDGGVVVSASALDATPAAESEDPPALVPDATVVATHDHGGKPDAVPIVKDFKVGILEPDGLLWDYDPALGEGRWRPPSPNSLAKATESVYYAGPFCFEWQYVHRTARKPYCPAIACRWKPPSASPTLQWDASKGQVLDGTTTTPIYYPNYALGDDPPGEEGVVLRVAATVGMVERWAFRRMEVFRDHLARDRANFTANGKFVDLICGSPLDDDYPWHFYRYNHRWKTTGRWNCYGSVWHAYDGTGTGWANVPPPEATSDLWDTVFEKTDPDTQDWEELNTQRGDVVCYYSLTEDDEGNLHPTLEHAATVFDGKAMTFGANNAPHYGRYDRGGEWWIGASFIWYEIAVADYVTLFNQAYLNFDRDEPVVTPLFRRVKLFRRKEGTP